MASTVLSFGTVFDTCSDMGHQQLAAKRFRCRYKIHHRESSMNMSDYNVERDFHARVYAYAPIVTVRHTLHVRLVRCDGHPTVVTNDIMGNATLSCTYVSDIAAAANIVPDGNSELNKIDSTGCQVYAFTRNEAWDRECLMRDNSRGRITHSIQYKFIDANDVPMDIRTVLRNDTLSFMREQICMRMNDNLRTVRRNLTETRAPLPLTVKINDAIDRSLTRFRENIKEQHAEKVELKGIHFLTYITLGTFHDYVVVTAATFENLLMIEGSGDTTATIQPNSYDITSTYNFPQARVHFDTYNFQSTNVSSEELPSGAITLIVQDLEIEVALSGSRNRDFCNESLWMNVTRISGFTYRLPRLNSTNSVLPKAFSWLSPTWKIDLKNLLGFHLVSSLVKHGAADYSDSILGLCISNSSKIWQNTYSAQTEFRFDSSIKTYFN